MIRTDSLRRERYRRGLNNAAGLFILSAKITIIRCTAEEHKQTYTVLLRIYRWVLDGVQAYVIPGELAS
jgi:hypothetical protein